MLCGTHNFFNYQSCPFDVRSGCKPILPRPSRSFHASPVVRIWVAGKGRTMDQQKLRQVLAAANTSLNRIAGENKQSYSWVHRVATGKANSEKVRRMIAKATKCKPEEIWPEHYQGVKLMARRKRRSFLRSKKDITSFCLLQDIEKIEQITMRMVEAKQQPRRA